MNKNLLIIFVKNPVLGKVKTRLAASLGNDKALEVYLYLLNYTLHITKALPFDKAVFYSEKIIDNDIWEHKSYKRFLQEGEELGLRMENAFRKAFSLGYEKVCIIGSDCFELREEHISKAFNELESNSVVLGPSYDGGYYLLGMNQLISNLFKNKNWSTSSVFHDTINDIEELQLNHFLLEKLNDIDEEKDLPNEIIDHISKR